VDGFLGAQLGDTDPVAGYFGYAGIVVGLVVCCFTVLVVLRARSDEMSGLTDNVLATGARRWAPLGWRVGAAAAGTTVILVVAGAVSAVVAPLVMPGDHVAVRAFAFVIGQWPVAMAVAGWTALWVGCWPRLAWLAWVPLVLGGTLALLGRLVGVPTRVVDLGPFQHVPDVAGPDPHVAGLAVLVLVAGIATLLGLAGAARRDSTLR
jgi:ABC-2 type transport system permease protein